MSKLKLGDAVHYSKERIIFKELSVETYVSTDNLLQNKHGKTKISQLPASTNKTPKYNCGDILVSNIRPYLKKIFYARGFGGASSDVLIFTSKRGFYSRFVYYTLFQDTFFEHMMAGSKGTKMPRGDKRQILEFGIPDYSLEEQQQIANVLSALDDKIELNNKINAELEAIAKTLYDYWFVQFDFPNRESKPYKSSGGEMVYDEVLKREIPKGWEVKKLGKVLKTCIGGTPSTTNKRYWNGKIPWMNSGEVANFPLLNTAQKITQEAVENSSTRFLKIGSVLLSITRHLRVNILGIDACINQSIAGVQENEDFKSSYIYFSILNDIDRLMSLRTGAQQPHINKQIVDSSPFLKPCKEILKSYYDVATPIFDKIFNNAKQNQELASLRDWLLPMLMNGQVKVAEAYKEVEEKLAMVAETEEEYKITT